MADREYIDRMAFIAEREAVYCADCPHRKNSKGKIVYDIGDAPCRACGIRDVLDDAEGYPAADVVEVVRCGECKHYHKRDWSGAQVCGVLNWCPPSYHYCAFGERKEQTDG